jgi:hypothetical protein
MLQEWASSVFILCVIFHIPPPTFLSMYNVCLFNTKDIWNVTSVGLNLKGFDSGV